MADKKSEAKSKSVKSQATGAQPKNIAEANVTSTDPNQNETIKLSDEQKTALDVQAKSTSGEPFAGKFKLKDPETQYAEEGFTLTGDQEKELPEDPSPELLARIRSGFIKKA